MTETTIHLKSSQYIHKFFDFRRSVEINSDNTAHYIVIEPQKRGGNCTINTGTGDDTVVVYMSSQDIQTAFTTIINGANIDSEEGNVILYYDDITLPQQDAYFFTFYSKHQTVQIIKGTMKTITLKNAQNQETIYQWDKASQTYQKMANKIHNTLILHADGSKRTIDLLNNDNHLIFHTAQGGKYTIYGGTENDQIELFVADLPDAQNPPSFRAFIDAGSQDGDVVTITFSDHALSYHEDDNFVVKSGNCTFNIKQGSVQNIILKNKCGTLYSNKVWNKTHGLYETIREKPDNHMVISGCSK